MASRKIEDLEPITQKLCLDFVHQCKKAGIDVLVYCTFRSDDEQNELYQIGRTRAGSIVTNARGGESAHNKRKAFDCVPMVGGKPQWHDEMLFKTIGNIGESVGLIWAGRWRGKLREMCHFETR